MDEQMKLFATDVLPLTVETPKETRCAYDVASDKVAEFARKAAARYSGEAVLTAVLRGYVDCVVEFLGLDDHQRAFLRTEAWNRAHEMLMLRSATDN